MTKKIWKFLINLLGVTLLSIPIIYSMRVLPVSAVENSDSIVEQRSDNVSQDEEQTDTIVNFPDPVLNTAIRSAFKLTDDQKLTLEQIKNTVSLGNITAGTQDNPVGDFSGMEYLQFLPATVKFAFTANFGSNVVDFSKLSGIRVTRLSLSGDFINTDVSGLLTIPTDTITQVSLTGNGSSYQQNTKGLQNSQLQTIGPWLTAIFNNDLPDFKHINLGNNSLSDFSPLTSLDRTRNGWVVSLGNNIQDSETVYVVDNDINQIQANPILGINGENINDNFNATYNIGADHYKSRNLKALGGGQYEYDPLSMISGTNFITYGYYGFQYDSLNKLNSYLEKDYSGDGTGLIFKYDTMVFRKVDLLDAPQITVKYVDQSGKQIQADEVIQGEKIGDEYDLTANSVIKNYSLVSTTELTGKYTQDPQIITLTYKNSSSGGNSSGNNGGGSGGTNVDRNIQDSIQYVATFADRPVVDLFTIDGHRITTRALDKDTDWYSDKIMNLNGVKYYRVATNEWIKANDGYLYTPKTGVVTTYNTATNNQAKTLFNAHSEKTNRALAPDTDWKFDKLAELNGKSHYRVATNEFVVVEDAYEK